MLGLLHSLRYSFARKGLELAPQSPGVYALFDEGELIYVGATGVDANRTIHACLGAHVSSPHRSCTRSATHYAWQITISSWAQASQILQHHKDKHGRLPRCNAEEVHPKMLPA